MESQVIFIFLTWWHKLDMDDQQDKFTMWKEWEET